MNRGREKLRGCESSSRRLQTLESTKPAILHVTPGWNQSIETKEMRT